MRNNQIVTVAGLILVRQKPGSAKGVTFMTIEDETDVANLVIWPSLFEQQRRLILSAGMLACRGRVQKQGLVIHVVADGFADLSGLLRSVGSRGGALPTTGNMPNRSLVPDQAITVKTRDFR
ncbi:OB-fold nucleic acid binding domain-containing protein [Microvirga sp. 2YAF29]|uniref:OB-fold nucleic acid binding domain-containing protein n=1 Tax=Microvirga sp. 2YAF29 TaxID=3233031 RepID=UPI003F9C75C9